MDPLMPSTRAAHHWTTTNLGEAAPGVLTPLGLGLWGRPAERATRRATYVVGMFSKAELAIPDDPAEWILRPFYGRLALRLEYMATVGDRAPGTTGPDAIRSLFGDIPDGMTFSPTRRRYPAIAARLPAAMAAFPGRLVEVTNEQDHWYRDTVARIGSMDEHEARATFAHGMRRFDRCSSLQLVGILSNFRPLYDALEALVNDVGVGDLAVLSGAGGAEMAVVSDIWRASRGELTVADVQREHGFHGPLEGEVSGRVWREDPAPLRKLIEQYAGRDDGEDPRTHGARTAAARGEMQAAVLQAVPASRRPGTKLLLKLAAERIPLRGVAKRAFLQAIDASRAAARRLGEVTGLGEDVFYLTAPELLGPLPPDVSELVAERRAKRIEYQGYRFAATEWAGLPTLVDDEPEAATDMLTGTGVSAGVAEGIARVVTDPSFAEVEDDEILVAATTDPSWSSIMFVSSALVVDLGGALSHAAVVARELQIPCVVNTRNGTRAIKSGDRVRVDGSAGTVEILARQNE